ncbi:MAG TPA: ferritin-like domain-containing protein [Solirubrobacteraceae bacterium]|nr:ferritin-like domain-containing protein [Solirubrobacteraceae bacterium]
MASSRLVAPELATIKVHGMTREAFLMRSTLAAGAAYGTLSATGLITKALADSGSGDVDILNFALTLEFLENEFYVRAAKQVNGLSKYESDLTKELRDNEAEHVDALTATIKDLGGKPASKPKVDFGGAFASRASYLKTANTLEDTGVSAYNGAAPAIESTDVLAAAGSIVQIEARHAALIRLVREVAPAPRAFDKASEMQAVLDAVKPFIAA